MIWMLEANPRRVNSYYRTVITGKAALSKGIAMVQWLASGTPTRTIRVRFPSDWLLHHGDNRGRHVANHNFLPDMHLRVKMCRDSRLV